MKNAIVAAGLAAALCSAAQGQVAISQIHAMSTVYDHDYIELFNRGNTAVNLTGWSLQFAYFNGNAWEVNPLTETVPAHSYYLVQLAPASGAAALPTPNDTGFSSMPLEGGKIFLVNDSAPLAGHCPSADRIVDWVLWGTGNCSVPTAPALSNDSADFRLNGGCIDTDDSAADFFSGFPSPHNSLTSHPCTSGPDCNGNGIDDGADLISGALTNVNANSAPDACEGAVVQESPISATVVSSGTALVTTGWRAQGTAAEDENGRTNPAYAAVRWSNPSFSGPLDARFGAGRWSIVSVHLVLKQDLGAAVAAGPVELYYTNNDSISLAPNTSGAQFANFNTDYADRQVAASWSFAPGVAGSTETYRLYSAAGSNPPAGATIANELRSGAGSLTLVLRPMSTTVVANYAGFTNTTYAGPTLVVFAQLNCGSADFNCDGDTGTDADIESFFACLSGNCPAAPCQSTADFNADGDVGTDADIEAFFRVLAGGTC